MAFINGTLTTNDFRTPLDQKRQRRATEREARRYLILLNLLMNSFFFLKVYEDEKIVN
jgi:hypothetical protein